MTLRSSARVILCASKGISLHPEVQLPIASFTRAHCRLNNGNGGQNCEVKWRQVAEKANWLPGVKNCQVRFSHTLNGATPC
jgi:hypothetical protein